MAKLSEIKQKNPQLNFSFLDYLTLLDSSDTNKFVPLMTKCILSELKKRVQPSIFGNNVYSSLRIDKISDKFEESKIDLNEINFLVDYFNNFLNEYCEKELILDFMDLYQKNYVENLDLNTISDLDQLREVYHKAHSKFIVKSSSKEVIKLIDDEEWLVIRPLTFESSRSYGSGTKWCTTSKNNPNHFFRYYSRGILIYCINKITGYKVAVFWDVNDESSPTFWNVLDHQIDSMMTELPPYILKHIRNLPKTSNKSLCDAKTLAINTKYEIEEENVSLIEENMAIGEPRNMVQEDQDDIVGIEPDVNVNYEGETMVDIF